MEFIQNIHLSDNIKNPKGIIKKLQKRQSLSDIYCICIDEKSNSILEIIHSHEIHKQVYQNRSYVVLGITNTKDEAKQMVCEFIAKMYHKDPELTALKQMLLQSYSKAVECQ